MSKKVFIGVGHGGTDGGAAKYIVEKEYTLKTAFAIADYLSEYGIDYKMSRTQDVDTDMDSKVAMCNTYKPDLVVDIHFNAGGGTGFEVYHSVVGGASKTLAENINAEIKNIFPSELGFVDTKSDADFIKANYNKLAKAYGDGIIRTLGLIIKDISVTAKTLDKTGCKKGDKSSAVLNLKALLLVAKKLGIHKYGMDKNSCFGDGTLKAVNYLLGKWGYAQTGIAGDNFVLRLLNEIEKRV